MRLIPAAEAAEDELLHLVRSVRVGKVYYAHTGRNAWWSTWITRYSRGCFHTSLRAAQSYCEMRRVQGTVFYIDEVPALTFCSGDRVLVATEINTTAFLSRIDQDRVAHIFATLPVTTFTFKQIYLVFRPASLAWRQGYPQQNSMLVHFGVGEEAPEMVAHDDELQSYQSRSLGGGYRLIWTRRPFTVDRSELHSFADAVALVRL